jgi:hypothetical protein
MSFKDADVAQAPQSPSYTTQTPLVYHSGTFKIDTVAAICKGFDLEISAGSYDNRGQIGSRLIIEQKPGVYSVKGTMDLYIESMAERDKFIANTITAVELGLTGAVVGTTTRRLKISLPTVFYQGETQKVSGIGDELMLKVPFEAIKTGGGAPDQLISVLLANSKRTVY